VNLTAVVICTFAFIILLSFVNLTFNGDNHEKTWQKLIGGLAVFLVAIIAQDAWVYGVSLFIGGLIIASERFMLFLAAIVRTAGDKMPETIKAFNVEKASPEEVKTKVEIEAQTEEIETDGRTLGGTVESTKLTAEEVSTLPTSKIKARFLKIKSIYDLVDNFFSSIYGPMYEKNIRLSNNYNSTIVDGIIREDGHIRKIVEIRYLLPQSFPRIDSQVGGFLDRIRNLEIKAPVLFVIVSEGMSVEDADRINMSIRNKYDVRLVFFQLADDQVVPVTPTNSETDALDYKNM